jgi:hypothetical protein
MPRSESSTIGRKRLAAFIENFGDIMPSACASCREAKHVCRVYVRSGRCRRCNERNLSNCNIRVTEGEFQRLKREKERLAQRIQEAVSEQESARQVEADARLERQRIRELEDRLRSSEDHARDSLQSAYAKESRLRKQLELIENRASDAIAILDREAEEAELAEIVKNLPTPNPALSPFTWSAQDGLTDDFWSANPPEYLGEPLLASGTVESGPSS